MKNIFFSSVGGHDPIANFHDGAMLHICRAYTPQKIILYLSREMLLRSRKDNRYEATIIRCQGDGRLRKNSTKP